MLNSLKPETFDIARIQIDDLFASIRVIHPKAYTVLKSLLKAYPNDHFRSCMLEAVGSELISYDAK
jgi:hypothetical protein